MKFCITPQVTLLFTLLIFFSQGANAAIITWTGGGATNDWATPANWSTAAVPGTNDDVVIPLGFTVDINVPVSKINSLYVDGSQLSINHAIAPWYITGFSPTFPFNGVTLENNATLINHGILSTIAIEAKNGTDIMNHGKIQFLTDPTIVPWVLRLDQSQLTNHDEISLDDVSFTNIPQGGASQFISMNGNQSKVDNYGLISHSRFPGFAANVMINMSSSAQFDNHPGARIVGKGINQNGIAITNAADQLPKTKLENWGDIIMDICTSCTFVANSAVIYVDFASAFTNHISGIVRNNGFVLKYRNEGACFEDNGRTIILVNPADVVNVGTIILGPLVVVTGSGVIDLGDISMKGTYQPSIGADVGIMKFEQPYQQPKATFKMYLAGTEDPNGGLAHDQIQFLSDGNVLTGTKLKVVLCDWYAPQPGDEFTLMTGQFDGVFQKISLPGNETDWKVKYGAGFIKITLLNELTNIKNVGVGVEEPLTKLHMKGGDIFVEDINAGIVFKTSEDICRKLMVTMSGEVTTASVPCPQ